MAVPGPVPGSGLPEGPTVTSTASTYKAATTNPALQMMGLRKLPTKLPSRNWLIFWTVTVSFSAAVIYDKREKNRATARWARAVSHLAKEPIRNPNQLPRKVTIYLESPPGDGLRVAQDHYSEYVKPILAASGLDWEFVQGRSEGDVRAAVAERIRRTRRESEQTGGGGLVPGRDLTSDEIVQLTRQRTGIPEWTGVQGDIVVGRHTWKEYVRGIHEGWLGQLSPPPCPLPEIRAEEQKEGGKEEKEEEKEKEEKPSRPPQPVPHNTTNDYPTSPVPRMIPSQFSPSSPISFPHILGFSNTFIRLRRFLGRRYLADEIGREVAAVCLATSRGFREEDGKLESEQQTALQQEERDWPKSIWKSEKPADGEEGPAVPTEKIWTMPVVLDPRISMRMRRFEMTPEDEARARTIVIPEEEIEGWIKGSFRGLYRWATSSQPEQRVYDSSDD